MTIRTASLLWAQPTSPPLTSSPGFSDHYPTLAAAIDAAVSVKREDGSVPFILVHSGSHGTAILTPAAIVVLDRELNGGVNTMKSGAW